MSWERLSLGDGSLIASYADHIQRYQFALEHCRGKRVLDAGCGTGYGSYFLAGNGAKSVLAVDLANEALEEAKSNYMADGLCFEQGDVELLGDDSVRSGQFDVVINFENLEHLRSPERFLNGAAKMLKKGGVLITSTPNGAVSKIDENGKLANTFHVREFTAAELSSRLLAHFESPSIYGQWLTNDGMLRRLRAREQFEQYCECYYNPCSRLGRLLKRLAGRKVAEPPRFTAAADSFSGDYVICPLGTKPFRWEPSVLIAICTKRPSD